MNKEFIQAIEDLEKERQISKDVLIEAIESALVSAYKKNYGTAQNVRVDIGGTWVSYPILIHGNVVLLQLIYCLPRLSFLGNRILAGDEPANGRCRSSASPSRCMP